MIGRIQHPKYTAAALKAANPLLLDGEVVYESDTGRHKIGDGVNKWTELPYPMNAEAVPAVTWKVQGGMLCVKPATDLKNPILKQCFVGILHYKNAKKRYRRNPQTGQTQNRPLNAGFKLVQDSFSRDEVNWTSVRINRTVRRNEGKRRGLDADNFRCRPLGKVGRAHCRPRFRGGGGNSSCIAAPI
ncbi:MAG: hypothetical protein ACLR93_12005 [Alistipes onderdonkii]